MDLNKDNIGEFVKKIHEFETTIAELLVNVQKLKVKLVDSIEKFGPDPSKWPAGEK